MSVADENMPVFSDESRWISRHEKSGRAFQVRAVIRAELLRDEIMEHHKNISKIEVHFSPSSMAHNCTNTPQEC